MELPGSFSVQPTPKQQAKYNVVNHTDSGVTEVQVETSSINIYLLSSVSSIVK